MSPPCLGPADSRGRGFGCQRDGAADRRENVCLAACRRNNAMANYKALRLVCSRPFAPEKPHERIRERPGA